MHLLKTTPFRAIGLFLIVLLLAAACIYHFRESQGFTDMMPSFIPWRTELVYITGILELVLALLILIPSTRRSSGIWTAFYLVLIFPANIYAALNGIPAPGQTETSQTALWARLLFQPLLIWWVIWCTKYPKKDA